MKVLIASSYPKNPLSPKGGVEAVVVNLANELIKLKGIELKVVTLDPEAKKYSIGNKNNIETHFIPYSRIPSRLSVLHNKSNIKKIIKKINPDIVHAQVAGVFALAASEAGLPWILTLHGIRFLEAELWQGIVNRFYRKMFIKQIELKTIKRAEHIISINPFIEETFKRQISGKVWNIENPISERFFAINSDGIEGRILFIGRLIIRKGVLNLLEAFNEVHKKFPYVKLHIAGGGVSIHDSDSYVDKLYQYVKKMNLEQAVVFRGELNEDEIIEEYKECSLFVLSSSLETAPMVTMQAMAAGKPVVSTDAGGSRYIVEDGKSGYIVPKEDSNQLAKAIITVLENHDRAKEMGRYGKRIAKKRFHAKLIARATKNVCQEILEKEKIKVLGD